MLFGGRDHDDTSGQSARAPRTLESADVKGDNLVAFRLWGRPPYPEELCETSNLHACPAKQATRETGDQAVLP